MLFKSRRNPSRIQLQLMGLSGVINLQKPFPLEMGLKMRSRELGGMRNLSKYLLNRLTGHAGLDSSEITTFLYLNYHEAFMKSDVTSSNSINIVKSEKTSETKNVHGNVT